MSERISYQFNGDHVLKFAGMQKLTGEQVADELNRLYTIIAEKNEQIAEPEQKAEPVAAPAGYFCEPYLNKPGLFEQVFSGFDDPDVIPLYRDPNGRIATLEREVEALRSLLSDVTCVAITMLYDTHKQDVLDEFTMDDLKEVVRRSEHLQIEKVEHIYRRGFEALAGGEAG